MRVTYKENIFTMDGESGKDLILSKDNKEERIIYLEGLDDMPGNMEKRFNNFHGYYIKPGFKQKIKVMLYVWKWLR